MRQAFAKVFLPPIERSKHIANIVEMRSKMPNVMIVSRVKFTPTLQTNLMNITTSLKMTLSVVLIANSIKPVKWTLFFKSPASSLRQLK